MCLLYHCSVCMNPNEVDLFCFENFIVYLNLKRTSHYFFYYFFFVKQLSLSFIQLHIVIWCSGLAVSANTFGWQLYILVWTVMYILYEVWPTAFRRNILPSMTSDWTERRLMMSLSNMSTSLFKDYFLLTLQILLL